MMRPLSLLIGVLLLLSACASVSTERVTSDFERADLSSPFPTYNGPKQRIQVVRFGIPEAIVRKYPELADRRVGWGLSQRIIETFYDTGRFEYLEEKGAILKRMADQWKLSQSGLVVEEEAIQPGALRGPQYLVYAEVYDFAVSYSEVLVGIAMEKKNTTVIGVQIRMVNASTGEYIPGSGTGESSSTAVGVWANPELPFDQSTVGMASQQAVHTAVRNLLKRIDKK